MEHPQDKIIPVIAFDLNLYSVNRDSRSPTTLFSLAPRPKKQVLKTLLCTGTETGDSLKKMSAYLW